MKKISQSHKRGKDNQTQEHSKKDNTIKRITQQCRAGSTIIYRGIDIEEDSKEDNTIRQNGIAQLDREG